MTIEGERKKTNKLSKLWQFSITIEEEKDKEKDKNLFLKGGTFSQTIEEEKHEGGKIKFSKLGHFH